MNSGIRGVGCDIVNVIRIEKLLANDRFLDKVCTDYERSYCKGKSAQTAAGIWAAKEAVSKAMGTGFCGYTPKDIEVCHDDNGRPQIVLHRGARTRAELLEISNLQISISHEAELALAFVVAE